MEEKAGAWKANLNNGLILGLVGISYSLIVYFLDMSFNKIQPFVFIIIQLALMYYLLKSYRDNFMHGHITYGQSVGAGAIIFLYYALIMAVFTYLLYAVIDTGLIDKQLAITEEDLISRGMPQAAIDQGMAFQKKLMVPAIMAPFSILGSMFSGMIISLIISIFIKKEGNPLIDTPENLPEN